MIPFLFYEMRVGDRIKAGEVIHLMTIIVVCKQFDNIELDLSAECKPIDESANDSILHQFRFGQTGSSSAQLLDSCSEIQLSSLHALCVSRLI